MNRRKEFDTKEIGEELKTFLKKQNEVRNPFLKKVEKEEAAAAGVSASAVLADRTPPTVVRSSSKKEEVAPPPSILATEKEQAQAKKLASKEQTLKSIGSSLPGYIINLIVGLACGILIFQSVIAWRYYRNINFTLISSNRKIETVARSFDGVITLGGLGLGFLLSVAFTFLPMTKLFRNVYILTFSLIILGSISAAIYYVDRFNNRRKDTQNVDRDTNYDILKGIFWALIGFSTGIFVHTILTFIGKSESEEGGAAEEDNPEVLAIQAAVATIYVSIKILINAILMFLIYLDGGRDSTDGHTAMLWTMIITSVLAVIGVVLGIILIFL